MLAIGIAVATVFLSLSLSPLSPACGDTLYTSWPEHLGDGRPQRRIQLSLAIVAGNITSQDCSPSQGRKTLEATRIHSCDEHFLVPTPEEGIWHPYEHHGLLPFLLHHLAGGLKTD